MLTSFNVENRTKDFSIPIEMMTGPMFSGAQVLTCNDPHRGAQVKLPPGRSSKNSENNTSASTHLVPCATKSYALQATSKII